MFDRNASFILLFVFFGMAGLVLWVAGQSSLALVDDMWLATKAGVLDEGWNYFYNTFVALDIERFRWTYELINNLLWWALDGNANALHVIQYLLRVVSCYLAIVCLRYITVNSASIAYMMVIAYGFFFPIAPESRLGTQEPIFSVFLMACLAWLCWFIGEKEGKIQNVSISLKTIFVVVFLLLTGSKEPGIVFAAFFLLVIVWFQLKHKHFNILFTSSIFIVFVLSLWRVWLVANSGYANAQANLGHVNVGWLFYQTYSRVLPEMLKFDGRIWSFVIISAFFIFALANIIKRSFFDKEYSMAPLIVVGACIISILLNAQMQDIVRYYEPTLWLMAIIIAYGLASTLSYVKNLMIRFILCAVVLLIALGNYPDFLLKFSAQQNAWKSAEQLIDLVDSTIDHNQSGKFFIRGWNPEIGWAGWDEWKQNEESFMLTLYYSKYRPRYLGKEPYILIPIEHLDWKKKNDQSYIISQANADELSNDFGVPTYRLILVKKFQPEHDSKIIKIYQNIRSFLAGAYISMPDSNRWIDAGAPSLFGNKLHSWYVYEVH